MLMHIDLIFFLRYLDVIIDAMDFGDGSNNISNDKDVFDYSKIILEKGFLPITMFGVMTCSKMAKNKE